MQLRRSFEEGHRRKLLIVVDESQEVESALYYAASRVQRSSGSVVMLYVIEGPANFSIGPASAKFSLRKKRRRPRRFSGPLFRRIVVGGV